MPPCGGNRSTASRFSCGFIPHPAILAKLLEIPPGQVDVVMGNDVRMTWVNNNTAMEGVVHEHDGEGHVDEWGIQWVKEGPYNQIARFPLANCPPDEVLALPFPRRIAGGLLARMEPLLAGGDEYFIGCDVSPCVFEMYWRLRGHGTGMMEMAGEPELAYEMFGRCADFAVQLSARPPAERFPLDWLWTGDDVASQRSLMMSPATWRTMIKPHLARVFAVGKAHGLWVAYHCCGALRPIIADLVEMGLDVLNPIQCNCPGMDPLGVEAGVRRRAFLHGRGRHAGAAAPRHGRPRCGGRRGG